jgi:hypothetical protein
VNNASIPKWRGVRGSRYTYARYYEQDPVYEYLHDLQSDPDQFKNFANEPEYKEILETMRARCDEYVEKYTRPEIVAFKKEQAANPQPGKKVKKAKGKNQKK